jgi:hypothetical protein
VRFLLRLSAPCNSIGSKILLVLDSRFTDFSIFPVQRYLVQVTSIPAASTVRLVATPASEKARHPTCIVEQACSSDPKL